MYKSFKPEVSDMNVCFRALWGKKNQ